ncbi:PAS domain-containing protein [Paenibacillus thalictri]|nr:PAS domain S-box protein [Paenibacillus thalictri]
MQMIANLFEHSCVGFFLIELSGKLAAANPAFCSLIGNPESELLKLDIQSFTHQDDLLLCLHQASLLLDGTIPFYTMKMRYVCREGEPVWCRSTFTLLCEEECPRLMMVQVENIDEQVKLEQELLASVKRMKNVYESIAEAFVMLDRQARYTYLNKYAESLLRKKREDVLGECIWDVFPALTGKAFHQEFYKSWNEMKAGSFRYYDEELQLRLEVRLYPSREGMAVYYRDTGSAGMKDWDGAGFAELLRSFFDHSADAIGILDSDRRMLKINKTYEDMFGYTYAELRENPLLTVYETAHPELNRLFEEVKRGTPVSDYEMKSKRKDGSSLDISMSISPIYDGTGEVISFSVKARDISDKKKSEEALRQSEIKYRLITENTSDLVTLVDANGVIVYASPSHEVLYDISVSSLNGLSLFNADVVPESMILAMKPWFRHMLESGQPSLVEIPFLRRNGQISIIETYGRPVRDDRGEIVLFVLITRDITKRAQTEALRRQSAKLSTASQLAVGIAHEIRNPLTVLKGFTQMMNTTGDFKKQYLEVMMHEFVRIEQMISELLGLAQPPVVQYGRMALAAALDFSANRCSSEFNSRGVQIITAVAPDLTDLWCDEKQLKKVFGHIIQNALEAMQGNGDLQITATRDGGYVRIVFRDQGPGIPQELIRKVGEPFYSTKAGGFGLGLMISQKIIGDHHGSLQIESEPGQGTTVVLLLPAH